MNKTVFATPRRLPAARRILCALLCVLMVLGPLASRLGEAQILPFGRFTVKDEKELGRKLAVYIRARLPLIEDPEIVGYCRDVLERLQAAMPPQPFELNVYVLNHSAVNAFAAPAGHVFIHSGLILNMERESELAGVLAHELAHVSQRHIASNVERMQTFSLISLVGMLAGVFVGGNMGSGMVMGSAAAQQSAMLKYSRENEVEADRIGMDYLVHAGYPPQGLSDAFEKIRKLRWLGGGGTIPTYLSTHPGVSERIASIEHMLERKGLTERPREDNTRFRRIQTLLRARYDDPKTAMQHFQKAGATTCLDALGRAIVHTRANRFSAAEDAFNTALDCAGDDPLVYREAGRLAFAKGDFDLAKAFLERAIALNPDDLMAVFFLARIYGDAWGDAWGDAGNARHGGPNTMDNADSGDSGDSGDAHRAVQLFERILLELPEDPEVHYYFGRMLGQHGQYFRGFLHLAYSSLYQADEKRFEFHKRKAAGQAATPEDRRELAKLEEIYEERKEFWQ